LLLAALGFPRHAVAGQSKAFLKDSLRISQQLHSVGYLWVMGGSSLGEVGRYSVSHRQLVSPAL
jgi:hypothetical protein